MAQVHVQSWRETFRGAMSDEILDSPGLIPWRERFWTAALSDERYAANRTALAEVDGTVVGLAMSGPCLDQDQVAERQLYALYLLEEFHGSGLGSALFDAVLDPAEGASLWIADPALAQARAHAFYRKQGFEPDGSVKDTEEIREVRLVRPASYSMRQVLDAGGLRAAPVDASMSHDHLA